MAEGCSNAAIAQRLVITGRAVEKHVSGIFLKLGIPPSTDDHRRVKAVHYYLDHYYLDHYYLDHAATAL